MGFINSYMHRTMKREAEHIADMVAKKYPLIQLQNPGCTEKEILQRLFTFTNLTPENKRHMEACSASVQGLCYMVVMDAGLMKGQMAFRCLQFTRYMDDALHARGFLPQSRETKEAVLRELNLLIDDWRK